METRTTFEARLNRIANKAAQAEARKAEAESIVMLRRVFGRA